MAELMDYLDWRADVPFSAAPFNDVDNLVLATLAYMEFPTQHWLKIRSNNVIERMNREIRRRTRVVGAFPDMNSALMLVCARLKYVSGKDWGTKRYLCMRHLDETGEDVA